MAETIGLASGILALATFAFQSSRVRDLLGELEALSAVLAPLVNLVKSTSKVDLSVLDLPLFRCGNTCKEFQQDSRACFRDWARLTYMGGNIEDLRDLLAGYKATINIALTNATL
ncbi:hypothetical protein BO99DRAFT_479327 [Aspergillus violaceofuscus CBS 115571]|uniref:Azaphilone pigments biosynthesis cluster protein L N-terminal domain-containing protein n=1 Tax=Aspergillus violaceofuscus (strain CBS 115571) TaxID=1450538 RepID=A0A2V5HFP8_ASPV1|nr:hypothetical protein BO99DRAFT_479327 [Aspergillus violaceofuscus CBS 115571]